MNNFNLLISTSRYNETNAKAELWFILLMCGDNYPIISRLTHSGLISALTTLDSKDIIKKIKKIIERDPYFFQFILKIVPIDFVCETSTKLIVNLIKKHYKNFITDEDTYKIVLNRRKHEGIERNHLIEQIANILKNKVMLENPDKIIRIEILGKFSGISFIKQNEIIKKKN
ncbi:MAG: THUMP domain-containing protein [Promethearchaeota archaeon]